MSKETFVKNMEILTSPAGIQKYILGTKKNGQPRAVYDVVRDYTLPKKKKKKSKKQDSMYSFYLGYGGGKKKKRKKKDKYWHI